MLRIFYLVFLGEVVTTFQGAQATSSAKALEFVDRQLIATCRDDAVGYCMYRNGGQHYQYCGDPMLGHFFFEPQEDVWCYATSLDANVCCGDAADCCQVKWKLVIGIMVGFSLLLTGAFCCLCCCIACLCGGSSKKVVRKVEIQTRIQHPDAFIA